MALRELWLIRHGESVGNVAATRAQRDGLDVIALDIRDADVPLSSTGEEQAVAFGRWLTAHRQSIDTYFVSPYARAVQTLSIAQAEAQVTTVAAMDERLRDRELGILDLLTRHGVESRHPEEAARRRHMGKFYHRPPGGESWADVALRLRSFLRDMAETPGSGALIVAHDAVVMLLLYVLLPLREQELLDFAVDHTVLNASVTHLVRSDDGWRLERFADVDHLQREGADVTAHPGDSDVQPR